MPATSARAIDPLVPPAPPSLQQILDGVPALVARIRDGAATRDRDRILPFDVFGWLREARIGTLLILRLYKLNDHDVQLMSKCNNGEITREEAEAQMINRY